MSEEVTQERPLAGRTAVVTGASSGIGRAIAERFGAAGATVLLAGRTREPMEASVKRIAEAGGRALSLVADVRDVEQVRALVERAVSETGALHILVNNAGISYPSPIADADPEHWRAMFDTNVIGLLAGCQAAIRAMRAGGNEGHIVNISSVAALRRDSGVYGATKHAVNCISATLRSELENDPIRVVTVMPGVVATNFARNFDPEFVAGLMRSVGIDVPLRPGEHLPEEVLETFREKAREMAASPEDVAEAVLFAVTRPIHVHIEEIVVRPPRQLAL